MPEGVNWWSIINTVIGACVVLILRSVAATMGQLKDAVMALNITVTKLAAEYAGHTLLDDARFSSLEHRFDAQRVTLESLRARIER